MTLTVLQNQRPSNLGDVLETVAAALANAPVRIPVQIGRHYDESNVGTPPLVRFVPELQGRLGPPITSGRVASWSHGCDVVVRAKPGETDAQRFRYAYALADVVIGALVYAAPGRIEWGAVRDDSPSTTDKGGAGVGLRFSFVFRRDVAQWEPSWGFPPPVDPPVDRLQELRELSGYVPPGVPTLDSTTAGVVLDLITVTPEE